MSLLTKIFNGNPDTSAMYRELHEARNAARVASDNMEQMEETVRSLETKIRALEASARETSSDHAREIRDLKSVNDTVVREQTNSLSQELSDAKAARQVAEKEIAIYRAAFENLGFDVKDMKEILNKLVDGLIAKQQIQLIK